LTPRQRTLEMWHFPKRCSLDQMQGAIRVLSQQNFDGKTWTPGRKETFSSKLGMAGLTRSGRALSPSGRRTLEALLRYFGFIYVDDCNCLHITKAGHQLLQDPVGIFRLQMLKLQLTNPITLEDCKNIQVFPFRVTLRLLLDLEHLDIHEIGYILFFMKSEAEYKAIQQEIARFRGLPRRVREARIEAYMQTREGQLTLAKAPSARYYAALCAHTGLCTVARSDTDLSKSHKKLILKEGAEQQVRAAIAQFHNIDTYDFANQQLLWIEYYGNPNRLKPPQLVTVVIG